MHFVLLFFPRGVEVLRVSAQKTSFAVVVDCLADERLEMRLCFRFVLPDICNGDVRLTDPFRQKAPFCLEENFLGARTLDGGRDGERRRKKLEAFESKIEVKVVAPFSVRDGTTFNEAEKFKSLPAKIVGEFQMKV